MYSGSLQRLHIAFLWVAVAGEPFVGASVGYFAFLALLAGRSLTVSLVQLVEMRQ